MSPSWIIWMIWYDYNKIRYPICNHIYKNAVFNPSTTKEEEQTLENGNNNDGNHDLLATLWNIKINQSKQSNSMKAEKRRNKETKR